MEVPLKLSLCVLFLCFTSSYANSKCDNCKGSGGPFLPGNVYKYKLSGLTVTKIPGSSDDVSTLEVTASAEIFAQSTCLHVLKLSEVEVKSADGKKYDGLSEDCAKPVKFSYLDGKINSICGEADDKGAALNIKRAVISLLSSAKKQDSGSEIGYENDIFGICPTDFSFVKTGGELTITKSKYLNRCALREDFSFPFPSSPYQVVQSSFGAFETSPLFGGDLKVTQTIKNGVLQKAHGQENYNYTPFLNAKARATVTVTYTLSLQGTTNGGSITANGNDPKGVYFEVPEDNYGFNNQDKIQAALQKATAALDPEAKPNAAKEFSNLVSVIEQGSKTDILQAYNSAQGKTAKNLFLDALLYAGSADSVEVTAELLKSGQIPKESAGFWYLDLNFVKHVSIGSLKSVLPLLSGDDVPHQAYLGIGSLAGKFCLKDQQLCQTSPEFKELLLKLSAPLASGCKVGSHEKENNVIASLKGLRNVRHLPNEVAQKIIQCATDKSAKTRVRAAAVEAFFADASKSEIKQAATSILKDKEEDSELRIKAYLSLVEHPCSKVADTIKDLIDSEPINQVGGFIVSHLRNLRASVSPEKEATKKIYGNIISKKRYPIDDRKFSKNYEVSYSLDAINVGAVGEVNRIFSQKSFIPRSVSLNLTTQIFGHSVNLAEVGLRAENLERILEKYFGPKGVIKTKGAKLFDDATDYVEDAVKKMKEGSARPKRSISKQETEVAASKIKLGPDYDDLDVDLDLSVKLFGSDVAWLNYHHNPIDYNSLKNKFNGKLDETLDKTKGIDIDYKKARRFIDLAIAYPTGLGLCLKLKLIANSAVNVKVKGQLDFKSIVKNPHNSHLAFQVVPSASFELQSRIVLDADVVEAGVKASATVHTSTGSDLTVKMLDGNGIDVKLGLPVKKQEIINFHSDIVTIVKEKKSAEVESSIKFNNQRKDHGGCFDQLNTLLGLTICGEISYPVDGVASPTFGPSKASLRFEKDDESLTAYHFKTFYNNKEPDQVSFEILLDTPNSKTNRKLSLLAQAKKKPEKHITITLTSPFKQATFDAFLTETEKEQSISAKLIADGSEYFVKVGAHVSDEGNRKKYVPLLEYKYPEATKSDRAWIGRKGTKSGKQAPSSSVTVTGAVYVEQQPGTKLKKFELKSVSVTTPRVKLTLDGTITLDENLVSTDIKAAYDQETITFGLTVQKLATHKYVAKVDFLPSRNPDLGGSIKWEFSKTEFGVENNLVIIHGGNLKSEDQRISISQVLRCKYKSPKDFEFFTDNSVTYPVIHLSVTAKGEATPKSVNYDFDFVYNQAKVKSALDAKLGTKHATDYSINFEGQALGSGIFIISKHEHLTNSKSKFTNSFEMKPGGKYILNGQVELSPNPGEIHNSITAELKLPYDPKNIKLDASIKQNNKVNELGFKITAASHDCIDIELKLLKIPEPSGSFKVLLQKLVDSHGSFQTSGGKLTGTFVVNLVKTGREIQGKGEFSKSDKYITGSGELLLDAKKDPTKKIHIETNTNFGKKSVDSKNKIKILNDISEFNVKGNIEGDYLDGTLVAETELVLPNGVIVVFKANRELHTKSPDTQIKGTWEILHYEAKGADPRKLVVKLAGKNINPTKLHFDGQADITYTLPSKEDLVLHILGKKMPKDDKWTIAAGGSLSGSLVKHTLSTKLDAEVTDQLLQGSYSVDKKLLPAHYDFELKADNEVVLHSTGKLNVDQINNEIEIKLPQSLHAENNPITSVKWLTSNTVNLVSSKEFKVLSNNALHWNNDKFVKLGANIYQKDLENHGELTFESHVLSVRTLKYKLKNDDKTETGEISLDLQWEGKAADFSVKIDGYSAEKPSKLKISSNVPDLGKYDADVYAKVSPRGESGELTISGSANNQKYSYSGKYSLIGASPYVDITWTTSQGTNLVYGKFENKGEKQALVESKIQLSSFKWELNGEVNIRKIDELYIKLYVDSPQLSLNKVDFEAKAEKAKTAAQRIVFHGKANDKEISGSLGVVSKGVAPNTHILGNGNIKVGENTYPIELLFKFDDLAVTKGYQYDISSNLKVGKHSGSITATILDDGTTFKFERNDKYCHESECKTDVYKLVYDRKGVLDYDATVEINLGLSPSSVAILKHPLVLKGKYTKDGWKYHDSTEFEYGPKKIVFIDYLNEQHTGFELVLPQRTIAGEVEYHAKKSALTSLKLDANFWLDKKNAADKKTSLLVANEFVKLAQGSQFTGLARFNSPGLKEMSVSSNININYKDHDITAKHEADIFANSNQKIVVEYKLTGKKEVEGYSSTEKLHIYSKGLNIETQVEGKYSVIKRSSLTYSYSGFYIDSNGKKREALTSLVVDTKSIAAIVKIPEGKLFSADINYEKKNRGLYAKGKYHILGLDFEEVVDVDGFNIKGSVVQLSGDKPQLDWDMQYATGQIAEVSSKFNKKPLFSLELALDESHFLKTKQSFNPDAAKDLIKQEKENAIAVINKATLYYRDSTAKFVHEVKVFLENINKEAINFKPALEYYQKELDKFKEEISSVKEIHDVIDFLTKTFGTIFHQINVILKEIATTAERLTTIFKDSLKKITESINAATPKIKQYYKETFDIFTKYFEAVVEFSTKQVNNILDLIKEHEKDLQEITIVITDLLHDVGKIYYKAFTEITTEWKKFIAYFSEQLNNQPLYNEIREKLQQIKNFKIPENYWDTYHESVDTVEKMLPTPELQSLFKHVSQIVEKLLRNQSVPKSEIVEQLVKEVLLAIRSVMSIFGAYQSDKKTALSTDVLLPVPSLAVFVAPPGTFRISLFNWLQSSDLPTLSEIFHSYRPKHSLLEFIPPFKASALLVGGTEFFTFDNKHYSFKGSCSYILSKDVLDGNFTIVANMDAGKLKSIAVFDHENSVELQHDNKVLVNGQPSDLPAKAGDLHLWSKYNKGIGFASHSGLMFFCTPYLKTCAFSINGYYFGKTRGLLGTYNNEPYDDIIVPSGKVAKTTTEFTNSWKVNPQCADSPVQDQAAPAADECTKLFSGDSSLRGCFPFSNPDNYREACNKQVAEASGQDKQERACNIALAYAGSCFYVHFAKVKIPDYCAKCQVGSQSVNIGDSVTVKAPQKKADVVVLVEQLEDNEEVFKNLITPLVSTLTNDLKEHQITDVHFALIGYGAPDQKWPALYTFDGAYHGFKGTSKNIHFAKKDTVSEPKLSDKLRAIAKKINSELGSSQSLAAFTEAVNYPFRPEAAKIIIGARSSECLASSSILPIQSFKAVYNVIKLGLSGVKLNYIVPFKDLELQGKDEKTAANIVGFDSEAVYTQSEAKRKVLKGDEEALKQLKYTVDACKELTLATKGTLFSATNFINGKPNIRKNFLQVLSSKIVQDVVNYEVTQECKCELDDGMIAKTNCLASLKEKEALSVKGVKGGVKA